MIYFKITFAKCKLVSLYKMQTCITLQNANLYHICKMQTCITLQNANKCNKYAKRRERLKLMLIDHYLCELVHQLDLAKAINEK